MQEPRPVNKDSAEATSPIASWPKAGDGMLGHHTFRSALKPAAGALSVSAGASATSVGAKILVALVVSRHPASRTQRMLRVPSESSDTRSSS
jgi:hypothetical protein